MLPCPSAYAWTSIPFSIIAKIQVGHRYAGVYMVGSCFLVQELVRTYSSHKYEATPGNDDYEIVDVLLTYLDIL